MARMTVGLEYPVAEVTSCQSEVVTLVLKFPRRHRWA